jgi:hypothetical protein
MAGAGPLVKENIRYSLGVFHHESRVELWQRNLLLMKAIADQQKIEFMSILQPALGTADRELSHSERELIQKPHISRHFEQYNRFYPKAREIADSHEFIFDLSKIFEEHKDVFVDDCHLTPAGNSIVAEKILNLLFQNEVL